MYRHVLPVRVISVSLLFGRYIWREALGRRRRQWHVPLALKHVERAGRIDARRSPDELDHLLKLGGAELGHNLVNASLMQQQTALSPKHRSRIADYRRHRGERLS
jgi:hypothetical protein